MEKHDFLTNEKIIKKFKSQFELVNYAIKLAENMIRTGRDSRVKTESQNRAMQVLSEIAHNKDHFDDIPEELVKPADINGRVPEYEPHHKASEKKKNRKIL